jgi:hypothetical protein
MVALASLVLALTATTAAQSDDKIVQIDVGMIQGAVSGDVMSFKGHSVRRAAGGGLTVARTAAQNVVGTSGASLSRTGIRPRRTRQFHRRRDP